MTILQLLWSFFQVGLFSIGGGYAAMPLIQAQTVTQHAWLTMNEFADLVTIAEMTPGPIAINAATFVGYRAAGFWGSFCATLGVVLPSFVIISLISFILDQFQSLRVIRYAFMGIRAGVLALILKALWGMFKKTKKGVFNYCISVAAFILVALLNVNVLLVIALSAAVGLIFSLAAGRRKA